MGWWKKLKKKISIKNAIKGVKKASKFLPGGELLRQGAELLEQGKNILVGSFKPTPQPESPDLRVAAANDQPSLARGGMDTNMLLLVGAAVAVLFLMRR